MPADPAVLAALDLLHDEAGRYCGDEVDRSRALVLAALERGAAAEAEVAELRAERTILREMLADARQYLLLRRRHA